MVCALKASTTSIRTLQSEVPDGTSRSTIRATLLYNVHDEAANYRLTVSEYQGAVYSYR